MNPPPSLDDRSREFISEEVWYKCEKCKEILFREDFENSLHVCPACDHHYPLDAYKRIELFTDKGSFKEDDFALTSTDPLKFSDRKPYKKRLAELKKKLKVNDALVCGSASLSGKKLKIAAFNFAFLGGSMGAVVGEKIARLFRYAMEQRQPVIIFSASGGARMQEGLISLMQMAKTCAALAQLRQHCNSPFISVLTDPTTGGVAASFAMLGDINIAEPRALIGFAGPRVIQQTIRERLPAGFQRSEFLLKHGMLDMICHRNQLRETLSQLLSMLTVDQ